MSESKAWAGRLSKNVVPKVYNLKLVPNMTEFTFQGYVDITLEVVEVR